MNDSYIFVQLMGGLGNQLFQYAAGLLQRRETNGKLYLCKTKENHHDNNRDYRDVFTLAQKFNSEYLPHHITLYQENAFSSWNPINYDYSIVYMYGYFQNYTILKPILNELKYSLLETFQNIRNNMLRDYIIPSSSDSGFIHVRRGDYLVKSDIHHVQDIEYYKKGVSRLDNISKWYIFSDDIEWCKQQEFFIGIQPIYIEETDPVLNLILMSEIMGCAIIANSTFSWMGAYLGVGLQENRVIYPKQWFHNETPDLFPSEWIGL